MKIVGLGTGDVKIKQIIQVPQSKALVQPVHIYIMDGVTIQ